MSSLSRFAQYKSRPCISKRLRGRLARKLHGEQLEDRRVLAVVTSLDDSGAGSLRNALAAAAPGETITFGGAAAFGTITLTSGELLVNKGVTIDGGGQVTVSGNNASRVFRIDDSLPSVANVSLRGLTIVDGRSPVNSSGGGILSMEQLTMEDVAVTGSRAVYEGGGVAHQGAGGLILRNCTISGNFARENGGGLSIVNYSNSTPTIEIQDTTVSNNVADSLFFQGGRGGGIYVFGTTDIRMDGSIVSGNSAVNPFLDGFSDGGGIYVQQVDGQTTPSTIVIHQSAVSGNSAELASGMSLLGPTTYSPLQLHVLIEGSEISGNEGQVGVLSQRGVDLTLLRSTVTGNFSETSDVRGVASQAVSYTSGGQGGHNVLKVYDSKVTSNYSTVDYGFGVITFGASSVFGTARLRIKNSSIANNSGGTSYFNNYGGAGITAIYADEVLIQNSTISGNNNSTNSGYGYGFGASFVDQLTIDQSTISGHGRSGVSISYGNATITRTTVSNNAFGLVNSDGHVTLANSILSGNLNRDWMLDYNGTSQASYSLIGNNDESGLDESPSHVDPDANGNLIGGPFNGLIDALLGPLADNGGPALTHALLPGSPAVDRGAPGLPTQGDPPFDQRGANFHRVADGDGDHVLRRDMGAFEVQPVSPLALIVDTLVDELDTDVGPGDLSLREAITLSNAWPSADTITFSPGLTSAGPGTLLLGSQLPGLVDSLTIQGPGSNLLTIGNTIVPGKFEGLTNGVTFSFSGLTLAAGGIKSVATEPLSLTDIVVADSTGFPAFGPICDAPIRSEGDIHLANSVVRDSALNCFFRGTAVWSGGNITLDDSVIRDNIGQRPFGSSYYGAAITAYGSVTVRNTTISGNQVQVTVSGIQAGGGIHSRQNVTVEQSTISGNSSGNGSGIYALGNVSLLNSTVSGNTATNIGGGVLAHGLITVDHSTITANSAGLLAGGVFQSSGMILRNSIVAQNTAPSGPDWHRGIASTIPQVRFSLVGSNEGNGLTEAPLGSPDINGNLVGGFVSGLINPQLGPLANNGGPTRTHALLPGSPALNAGDPAFVGPPNFDQRGAGFARVSGGRLDMGAFEVQSVLPDGDFNNDGFYNCADINALVGVIAAATHNPAYDLTGDALVNLLDRDAWLAQAATFNGLGSPYKLGDADLNGVVDGVDFIAWNAHKFTNVAEWCSGDWTADGVVDGVDFIAWNANKFTSSDASPVLASTPSNQHTTKVSSTIVAIDDTHLQPTPTQAQPVTQQTAVTTNKHDAIRRSSAHGFTDREKQTQSGLVHEAAFAAWAEFWNG